MPAYRERIYIIPEQGSQPVQVVDFPVWWDRRRFFEEFGHRQIDSGHPAYVDYGLLLAAGEALAWDKRAREQFASDLRSQEPFFLQAMQQWDAALAVARYVIVESYEWESGLS